MTGLHQDLQAVWDRYLSAYKAGDAVGCAACYTPDGEIRSPYGPTAIGRTAIAAQHGEWVKLGGNHKTLTVESAGGSGDVAWCLSHFSEGAEVGNGTNLSVFERQPGGGWLVRQCSLNSTD